VIERKADLKELKSFADDKIDKVEVKSKFVNRDMYE
jgi:hypothetical protein